MLLQARLGERDLDTPGMCEQFTQREICGAHFTLSALFPRLEGELASEQLPLALLCVLLGNACWYGLRNAAPEQMEKAHRNIERGVGLAYHQAFGAHGPGF